MPHDEKSQSGEIRLKPGQKLYTNDGVEIGVIQGITDIGVEVNVHDDFSKLSLEHAPNENYGEGYLVWRCSNCGELGAIDEIPDECPNCGEGREGLYAYLED